jgi:hypothetical protein
MKIRIHFVNKSSIQNLYKIYTVIVFNLLYYEFFISLFFTFSSDQLQIKWRGLDVDLSPCYMITEMLDGGSFSPKKVFLLFKLPSQKSKNRKYISQLFNPSFNEVPARTKLLVNLFLDRQALGFQEVYLNPLLRECITRGFCKSTFPVDLEKLKFFKEIRFSCFEYVKKNMATDTSLLPKFFSSVLEPERSIRSSPEWNELIDGKDGDCFLDALVQFSCNYLYLDGLSSNALTFFFQKIKALNKRHAMITVSNSQIDLTLFELRICCNNKLLALKNCPNLKLGKNDQEISEMIDWHIMYSGHDRFFTFQNCSLDSESLEKCKEYGHNKSIGEILLLVANLCRGLLVLIDLESEFAGEEGLSLFAGFSWTLPSGCLMLTDYHCKISLGNHIIDWGILIAMRIAHFVIPMLLKDRFVFGYRLVSAVCMLVILCCNVSSHYSKARKKVGRLIQNPFGIMTKYAFLDKLCKLFLWI